MCCKLLSVECADNCSVALHKLLAYHNQGIWIFCGECVSVTLLRADPAKALELSRACSLLQARSRCYNLKTPYFRKHVKWNETKTTHTQRESLLLSFGMSTLHVAVDIAVANMVDYFRRYGWNNCAGAHPESFPFGGGGGEVVTLRLYIILF
jgi:hypothetical protein